MPSEEYRALVAQQSRTATIIWAAMLATIAVYGGVVYYIEGLPIPPGHKRVPEDALWKMRIALSIVAVPIAAASLLWARIMTSPRRMRAALPAQAPAVYERTFGSRLVRMDHSALSVPERRAIRALPDMGQTVSIVSIAFGEAVAIFGVVLGLMARDLTIALPHLAAGGLLVLLRMPRIEEMADRLLAMAEAEPPHP